MFRRGIRDDESSPVFFFFSFLGSVVFRHGSFFVCFVLFFFFFKLFCVCFVVGAKNVHDNDEDDADNIGDADDADNAEDALYKKSDVMVLCDGSDGAV